MSEAVKCMNCGRVADVPGQKFCPACGQATPVHRIDWHFMAHELEHSVLHMDRGILYSLKELMLRPGRLIRDYLDGRRARQAKPFLLLMAMSALMVFLGKYAAGGELVGAGMAPADAAHVMEVAARAQAAVDGWMNRNFALSTLLFIPFEALAFRAVFTGPRCRLNYPEWLVVVAFLTVQTFVLWGLSLPLQRWWPPAPAVAVLVAVIYGVYSLVQLFPGYPRWKSVLRALSGFVLFSVATVMLSAGVAALLASTGHI